MVKRVALFAPKVEIENYFEISTRRENLFEPHYNISPGQHIPLVIFEDDEKIISRSRWGAGGDTTISAEKAKKELNKKEAIRCVLPLSGFYLWKEQQEQDHPFFVRMLNNPVMAVAGIYYKVADPYFKIVMTESNPLIYPMSKTMPLLLDQNLAGNWLDYSLPADEILNEAGDLFLLTDISVMRVDKKVNDPTQNDPSLVQPIPK